MLVNVRRQHPVGQGFFSTGEVRTSGAVFSYVYDCGSFDRHALEREIASYVSANKAERIDALFVSHLDWDHVSGLDVLLGMVRADTVFLPYLNATKSLFLAAAAVAEGDPSADYIHLVSNPPDWLGSRGTGRVAFLRPDDSPLQIGQAAVSLQAEAHITIEIPPVNDPESLPMVLDPHNRVVTVESSLGMPVEVYDVSHSTPLRLRNERQEVLNWMFAWFAHPHTELEEAFREIVEAAFPNRPEFDLANLKPWNEWLLSVLQRRAQRKRLAACYKSAFRNRNLTSLVLYSGPIKMSPEFQTIVEIGGAKDLLGRELEERPQTQQRFVMRRTSEVYGVHGGLGLPAAWLGTGDSDFRNGPRRDAFQSHYAALLDFVLTLAVPHHGSSSSFHERLLGEGLAVCVASAGRGGRYGHPHSDVIDKVATRGKVFLTVTEDPRSAYHECVGIGQAGDTDLANRFWRVLGLLE